MDNESWADKFTDKHISSILLGWLGFGGLIFILLAVWLVVKTVTVEGLEDFQDEAVDRGYGEYSHHDKFEWIEKETK